MQTQCTLESTWGRQAFRMGWNLALLVASTTDGPKLVLPAHSYHASCSGVHQKLRLEHGQPFSPASTSPPTYTHLRQSKETKTLRHRKIAIPDVPMYMSYMSQNYIVAKQSCQACLLGDPNPFKSINSHTVCPNTSVSSGLQSQSTTRMNSFGAGNIFCCFSVRPFWSTGNVIWAFFGVAYLCCGCLLQS